MSSLFQDNLSAHTALFAELAQIEPDVVRAGERVAACLREGGKLMLCGNGGSSGCFNRRLTSSRTSGVERVSYSGLATGPATVVTNTVAIP